MKREHKYKYVLFTISSPSRVVKVIMTKPLLIVKHNLDQPSIMIYNHTQLKHWMKMFNTPNSTMFEANEYIRGEAWEIVPFKYILILDRSPESMLPGGIDNTSII